MIQVNWGILVIKVYAVKRETFSTKRIEMKSTKNTRVMIAKAQVGILEIREKKLK